MNIKYTKNQRIPFEQLDIGDVFTFENYVYMRVHEKTGSINAVVLTTGYTKLFPLNTEVVK